MNEQIQIKSPETLQGQLDQFKDATELSPQEQALIEKYSEQILQITDLNNLPEDLPGDLVEFVKSHREDYLRILREDRKQSEYESFSDMQFEEVVDNNGEVIEVTAKKDESKENVELKLQDRLKEHNWWLQDYWREKGIPKEQITIQTPSGNIEVFNFSEPLTERHLQEFEELVQVFAQAKDKTPLQEIKYILLDDTQPPNPNTGEDMNGYGSIKEGAIKLYPRGKQFIPHRIPEASNFEGTVIHELSHSFPVALRNEWSSAFGWKMLDTAVQLPGGAYQYYECENPERCISEYAKINPSEDICESMVAAIKAPETLDSERLAFIQEKIFGNNSENKSVTITRLRKVSIPKIEQPIRFKRKEPPKISIRRIQ